MKIVKRSTQRHGEVRTIFVEKGANLRKVLNSMRRTPLISSMISLRNLPKISVPYLFSENWLVSPCLHGPMTF
jgi:hypothetical protein